MLIQKLEKKQLIHPPKWLANNTIYLTYMGSVCYGTNTEESDIDIYGISLTAGASNDMANITEVAMRSLEYIRGEAPCQKKNNLTTRRLML